MTNSINRKLQHPIEKKLFKGKAIIVTGPRQVGKTTLIHQILEKSNKDVLFLNGDDREIREMLNEPGTEVLRQILGDNKIIFIDEAQRIPEIGLTAKIITDRFKDKQLIMSGSSALDMGNLMQEPLTGRKWTFELLPISWEEWEAKVGYVKAEQDLENRLIFGFYPDILNHPEESKDALKELANSYLYKDVFAISGIRKPEVIQNLVQALAYQVGSEVNMKELGDTIGADSKTVSSYIDILEQAYVVFRLPSFQGNLRNEIKKSRKIYFYDNGIRNVSIDNLDPLSLRQDIGKLWENFLIAERLKLLRNNNKSAQMYFWRTKQQQEIDYLEMSNGKLSAFEFKWNPKKKIHFSKTFTSNYDAEVKGITPENFREFVVG